MSHGDLAYAVVDNRIVQLSCIAPTTVDDETYWFSNLTDGGAVKLSLKNISTVRKNLINRLHQT